MANAYLWALTFICLAKKKKINLFNLSEVQSHGDMIHWPNLYVYFWTIN